MTLFNHFVLSSLWCPLMILLFLYDYSFNLGLLCSSILLLSFNYIMYLINCNDNFTLKVQVLNDEYIDYYKNFKFDGNSGLDIVTPKDYIIPKNTFSTMINLGIKCEPLHNQGYDLRCRSSIYKTPLILANHIGTIDATYRGEIKAVVRNLSNEDYHIKKGDKLFQLTCPSLKPFNIKVIGTNETLIKTHRNENGFGSTG